MTRLKIALMAGGDSPEREIALQSAALIEVALDHSKYDITVIDLHGRDWHHTAPDGRQWQVDKNAFSITVDGVRKAFDYALIIIHGTPGEDGKLQGYLDMMGVPYSSCSMTSSVITFDKITAKRTLAGRVNLAREVFLRRGEAFDPAQIVAELGMPLFVKPNANGSSFGVTKVHAPEELPTAIEAAFAQGDEILIEECVAGREMGCGMLVAGGREYVFPITEIVSKKDFFDYEAKYTAGFSDEITPADITPEVKAELNRMTREAYRTCRCSGVVRVDFIVTPAGVPYFIELNSIPGMSGGSIVPKQAREMGMSLGELYDIIIADTKFEFGVIDGKVTLIDECLTPDSSRFWPAASYEEGKIQPSYDKQFVRNWLKANWDMTGETPHLPAEVIDGTSERYREAFQIITGSQFTSMKENA